jgi:hypothetical protein
MRSFASRLSGALGNPKKRERLDMKYLKLTLVVMFSVLLSSCAMMHHRSIEKAQREGIPVVITAIYSGRPDFAGGVDAHINFVNTSSRTLKYVILEATPYNRVGDIAASEIGRKTTARLEGTGPYAPGRGNFGLFGNPYWTNVWYNHTIRCIEVNSVEVVYMDGSRESFVGEKMSNVIAEGVTNSCSVR